MKRFALAALSVSVIAVTSAAILYHSAPAHAQANNEPGTSRTQFGAPILLEGSNTVLVPFGGDGLFIPGKLALGPAFFLSDSLSGGVGSPVPVTSALALGSCFDSGEMHWNNAIVYDAQGRQSRLLLNRRATILHFYAPRSEPAHDAAYLLFAIADNDTNQDGVIDDHDAVVLYVSDAAGRSLAAVTPPDAHFNSVTFTSRADSLYAQISTDPESTHKFTGANPVQMLRIDPLHPAVGAPIWTDDLPQQALHLVQP